MAVAPVSTPPVFGPASRWALRVLAWIAFAVSGYLAWHSVTQTSVLGCDAGSGNGCDEVLGSAWSKFLGIPVALPGLGCYAALATLSALIGLEGRPAGRWIKTAFIMLSLVAAVGSIWFIGVQVVAIGKFCPYCLVCDVCGIALGGITLWSVTNWHLATRHLRRVQTTGAGLAALRTALPIGTGSAVRAQAVPVVKPIFTESPSLPVAICGGVLLSTLLIVGQILFPSQTHSAFSGELAQPLALDSTSSARLTGKDRNEPGNSQSHTALRIPPDSSAGMVAGQPTASVQVGDDATRHDSTSASAPQLDASTSSETNSAAPNTTSAVAAPQTGPRGERVVEFLKGSLRLDVYKHPLIGRPDAPHVIVELLSYNCPHCRQMHRLVQKGLTRYRDQVAIIVIPVPMEMKCNKLLTTHEASHVGACTIARMALGVAAIQPHQFHKFHDWLMADKDHPPQQGQAISQAYATVDRERLRSLSRQELERQIAQYVDLLAQLRSQSVKSNFGLPVQILNDHIMSGMVAQESDLFDAWEKHLGLAVQKP